MGVGFFKLARIIIQVIILCRQLQKISTYNGRVTTKLKANATSAEAVRFADFHLLLRKRPWKRPLKMLLVFEDC